MLFFSYWSVSGQSSTLIHAVTNCRTQVYEINVSLLEPSVFVQGEASAAMCTTVLCRKRAGRKHVAEAPADQESLLSRHLSTSAVFHLILSKCFLRLYLILSKPVMFSYLPSTKARGKVQLTPENYRRRLALFHIAQFSSCAPSVKKTHEKMQALLTRCSRLTTKHSDSAAQSIPSNVMEML